MKYGNTYVTTTMPWGLFPRTGHRLLCADGKVRAASLAQTADTFFSVPASVRIKGRTVTGYMTTDETGWPEPELRANVFRHHSGQEDKLPDWPLKFTDEHNQLIKSVHETK